MVRPGIVLARSGLHFAIKRLKTAEQEHASSPTAETEAKIVRSGCESLFWLFALSEDFEKLIDAKTGQNIFQWCSSQGENGKIMNALRLIRNRVTHSYEYYWKIWNFETLTWGTIARPKQQELSSKAGKYVPQQFLDYQASVEGKNIIFPLESVANAIESMYMKFNLVNW
jgi:hypothetical protein